MGIPNTPFTAGAETYLTALAFKAFQQRSFLAADVGTGAKPHFELEALAAAEDVIAKAVAGVGGGDCRVKGAVRVRVLAAQVDIALRGAGGDACDSHAFDQQEGIAFHHHAVGEGARVALVGIADDVLLVRRGLAYRLPFDAGGKRGSAAAA